MEKLTSSGQPEVLLSVLIPTLKSRSALLKRVTDQLEAQRATLRNPKSVQVLLYSDNKERSTGFKRNKLMDMSKGIFTVFVDDDDKLGDDYLSSIIEVIENNPNIDAIGIQGKYSENGSAYEPFETSLAHHWEKKDGWYFRTINHISPIRRAHAIQVRFPCQNRFEDYEWTMALKKTGLLKKEVVIKKCMYIYDYIHNKQY
jgi:hypothetical protein